MRKSLLLVITALSFLVPLGCHGQLPPTNSVVTLTGTPAAPSGTWLGCVTGQPVCTLVFSRLVVPAGTTTCQPPSGGNYVPLNASAPVPATYTDNTVSGLTACYVAQTLQAGNVSAPSNIVGPLAVPASPLAPALNGQTATASLAATTTTQPEVRPVLASMTAPRLQARIEPR